MKTLTKYLICFLIIITMSTAAETNWPRHRGPHNNGIKAVDLVRPTVINLNKYPG